MFQEIIALIIIAWLIIKLILQKQKQQIPKNEFKLWMIFWIMAGLTIIFLKQIDQLVSSLGFSGSGIQIVFYFAVVFLFYIIFKIRLRLARIEKDITKIVEKIVIKK